MRLDYMLEILRKKYYSVPFRVKASFWFLICSVMQKGISVITTPIFTRLMDTEQYGKYSVFNSWYSVIAVFVTLRLYYGVYSQGLVKFEAIRDKYSSALQGLTLTLCGVWFLIYIAFANFWNAIFSLSTSAMIAMFVIVWATAAFNFWAANQRIDYKYKELVIVTLIVTIAKPTLGVLMVINSQDKALARIWGLAIVELICYFWLFLEQLRKGKTFFSRSIWKYAVSFNIPLIPHYLSQTILSNSDRIMIEKLIDTSSAGIYSLAYSIAMLMLLFNEAMQQTLAPWIYGKIKDKKFNDIHSVAYISLILVAMINLLLIVIAPEAVRIFAPPAYHEAIWIVPPVAMSTYFLFLYNIFSYFEFYFEKTKSIALSTVAAALINVVLNYIFIKRNGYMAASYTTLICYILYALLHYFVMKNICKKECNNVVVYNPFVIIGIGAIFMILGFLSMIFYDFSIIRYGIIVIIVVTIIIKRRWAIDFYKRLRYEK